MQGAEKEFNEICDQLRNELDKNADNEQSFKGFQRQLFDTCIEVLEKLKNENFFKTIVGKEVF